MKTIKQKMRKSPLLAKNKVRADIFSGSLAVCAYHSEATISSFSLAEDAFFIFSLIYYIII